MNTGICSTSGKHPAQRVDPPLTPQLHGAPLKLFLVVPHLFLQSSISGPSFCIFFMLFMPLSVSGSMATRTNTVRKMTAKP